MPIAILMRILDRVLSPRFMLPTVLALLTGTASAVTTNFYYVDLNNAAQAEAPYRSWGTAAAVVQTAVAQAEGDLDIPGGVYCEVIVTGGVYVQTASIVLTKGIRLRSLTGVPESTILAGGYPATTNRVLTITGEAWVSGFTISNGYAYGEAPTNYGGGIFMTTNGAGRGGLVSECRIVKNQARLAPSSTSLNGLGCGVMIHRGGTVSNCLIQGNTSNKANGGGVYVNYGGLVADCDILDNSGATGASTYGGGAYLYYGGELRDCLIARNETRHAGGLFVNEDGLATRCIISNNIAGNGKGVFLNSGGTLRDCIVEYNISGYTSGSGGGVLIDSAGALLDRCVVRYNMAGSAAGISNDRSTIRNTLVYGNQTVGAGGGIVNSSFVGTTLENVTIVRNMAGSGGGLVIGVASAAPYGGDVRNVISYNNYSTNGLDNNLVFVPYTGYDPTNNNRLVFSCIQPTVPGNGNIGSDPLFKAPGAGYGTNATASDYVLKTGSPCIGTGTNVAWMTAGFDLAGNARIMPTGGKVDMGASEAFPARRGTVLQVR